MRYRVEVADRPDGLYAVWHEQVYRAQRSTADSTVLLVAPAGEDAPEGFDTQWRDLPAKVVPEAKVAATFTIHTQCLYDDEIYRIAPQSGEAELTLRWTGQDETTATQLGLTDFTTTTSDPESVLALWQERHDFTSAAAVRPAPGSVEPGALLRSIGRTMVRSLPDGWQRVAAQFRQVGDYSELEVRAVAEDVIVSLSSPPELGHLFARLRSAMYEAGSGTWFQGTFTLDSASNFDFDFDKQTEPNWRLGPGARGRTSARAYEAELEYHPRERGQVPQWLAARAGLPLDVEFRLAKVVDAHTEGEPPVVNRQPVAQDEARAVLGYLYRAPVALSKPGLLPDIFAPHNPPDVPDAFHTDGTWIWPASVPHYLRKYGLPPEPDLLAHIRAAGHRPPYVGERVRATAEAEILGAPRPGQTAADLGDAGADAELTMAASLERGAEPDRELRGSEVLATLRRRLAEQGIPEDAYRIGEHIDGAWCLLRTAQGWQVARFADGAPVEPMLFPRIQPAARALLGSLLLYPGRRFLPAEVEAREPATHATDWPVLPVRGEPPLTFYRGKRMITLPEGTTITRFGTEAGNLAHPEGTPFAETSLTFEREHDRHSYVLRRTLRVLAGIAVPWNGLPGGAITYLLPRPIGHHLETGALDRLG
ncbi:TNT domain-containing protein [Amycolatopsis palatopharyngis]|uniref:TNT domain-containing protein n=1 Tax=Amycolatopsis palatopharyngis TaxID=187982 RepID=UPI000E24FAF6|nr:TNT domain-containing protein [Amycolatopsis palatopharyngis]